jgi:hypothetical protein
MSLLNFESSGPSGYGSKKPFKLIFGIGTLVGAIALGSTFAASINLNSGGPVEFGQGLIQATACDDEITITPISSFINEEGGGNHKFSSLKISGIDSSSDKCSGKVFVIKAFGEVGQLSLFNYSDSSNNSNVFHNSVEIANNGGQFTWVSGGSDGDDVIAGPDNGITDTSFTLSFTSELGPITRTPLASTDDVQRITIESKEANCEQGFGCQVGSIGPGGGTIFYVAQTPFVCGPSMDLTCTYLEAAPTTGSNAWVDSNYFWSGNIVDAIGADARGTAIGTGYRNTLAIVGQADGGDLEDRAATDARAYRGPNNLTDWFIPSLDELTELFENRVITDISNSFDDFWSSTESDGGYALIEWFGGSADVYPNEKGSPNAVRPIRAF